MVDRLRFDEVMTRGGPWPCSMRIHLAHGGHLVAMVHEADSRRPGCYQVSSSHAQMLMFCPVTGDNLQKFEGVTEQVPVKVVGTFRGSTGTGLWP